MSQPSPGRMQMLALGFLLWAWEVIGAKLNRVGLVLPADGGLWKHATDV